MHCDLDVKITAHVAAFSKLTRCTPCAGHTFCRGCLMRSLDHTNRCPMCRTVLHTRLVPQRTLMFLCVCPQLLLSRTVVCVRGPTDLRRNCRSARKHPISVSLQSILSKYFPAETEERRNESTEEINHGPCVLPLFVVDYVLPGQVSWTCAAVWQDARLNTVWHCCRHWR